MQKRRHRHLAVLAAIVLLAFFLRAVSLDGQPLWRDEVDALRFATAPRSEVVGNFFRHGWNGPLYHLLLRGWMAVAGTSEYALRYFSLLFGLMTICLAYVLGRRFFGPSTGLVTAVLMALSPYMVWYAQEVKMYTLVTALALLAIYALRRAVEGGGWRWWSAQVGATSVACYVHILAALLIPLQVLIVLAWWPRARRRWRGALASFLALTLPYLPLAQWQLPLVAEERATGFTRHTLGEMAGVLVDGWSGGIYGSYTRAGRWAVGLMIGAAALGGLSVLLAAFGGARFGGRRRARGGLVLLLWLAVPLLAVWWVSLRQPIFTDRYFIWVAPAFYYSIALGITWLGRRKRWPRWVAALLLLAIVALNGVNLRFQTREPFKSDFRAAARYVAQQIARERAEDAPPDPAPQDPPPGDHRLYLPLVVGRGRTFEDLIVFQIPYIRHTFDYYFPHERYPWAEGLYTNHRLPGGAYVKSEEQVAREMAELTDGHETVWLIVSEMAMWDERGLVKAWLDRHLDSIDEAHFMRVDVYRYER